MRILFMRGLGVLGLVDVGWVDVMHQHATTILFVDGAVRRTITLRPDAGDLVTTISESLCERGYVDLTDWQEDPCD